MLLIVRSKSKSRPPEEEEKGEEGVATTTVTNINNILRKRKSNTKSAKTREVEVVKEVNQDPLRNRPMMNMVLKKSDQGNNITKMKKNTMGPKRNTFLRVRAAKVTAPEEAAVVAEAASLLHSGNS